MAAPAPKPFHVMAKPIGSTCNLQCRYCYYLSKEELLAGRGGPPRMSPACLEEFTRQYIQAHRELPEITFAWQGGEPTLMGLEFFRQAVALQKRYAPAGATVANSIQTNGTLLDDAFCDFFAANRFLVGLSLDGPAELHDAYRRDKGGGPTFGRAMAGLKLLQKHKVDVNALVVVNRANSLHPREVYRFLRDEAGLGFIQFIPCVERRDFATVAPQHWTDCPAAGCGLDAAVTPWSVEPERFGEFLCGVFDEWLAGDVGRVFVQTFDVALGQWMGLGSALCVFAPTCGLALAMERDGSLYACDHYVYPEFRRGRIEQTPLIELARCVEQQQFGRAKSESLPRYCRDCPVLFACNGECPKNRFIRTPTGEPGLNYLCAGLRRFFTHIDPWMKRMAVEVAAGRPAANAMNSATRRAGVGAPPSPRLAVSVSERVPASAPARAVSPNAPCPCGSGRKFKKCCMRR